MTQKELLNPRYRVIADYPGNKRSIGFIFLMDGKDDEGLFTTTGYLQEGFFTDYPHLFRKLEWWEDRKPEEMPQYVRCLKSPDQIVDPDSVLKVSWNNLVGEDEYGRWILPYTNCYEPATESEYTTYINSKK